MAYAHFTVPHSEYFRSGFRAAHPEATAELARFRIEGLEVGFSYCAEAVQYYGQDMVEFAATWAAVRTLGLYEAYIRSIEHLAWSVLPGEMRSIAKKDRSRLPDDWLCRDKQGRGAQLFIRLCRYSPPESYIPSLDFFFELRNVAIHRDGRCDERLARAAELAGHTIHVGTRVSWTFSLVMQLHHLLTDYLTDVDRGAVRVLGLETRCGRPYWFIDEALSEEEKGIGR
jgi:hypothetical protein